MIVRLSGHPLVQDSLMVLLEVWLELLGGEIHAIAHLLIVWIVLL